MSTFDPAFYRRYRPYYPPEAFDHFTQRLKDHGLKEPYQIADIGCGTGHSIISLLRTGIEAKLIGIDPDAKMLEQAKLLTQTSGFSVDLQLGSGEQTGLKSLSLDAAIIGSAFHWMDPMKAKDELARILKPQGLIRIMEYQFPKASNHPGLNEWIRRQFNLYWKAPNQKPRGTFIELLSGFQSDQRFHKTGSDTPRMILSLTLGDLHGLLWSQSRVLCYLATLTENEKERHCDEVRSRLEREFENSQMNFDFKLQWIEFGRMPNG